MSWNRAKLENKKFGRLRVLGDSGLRYREKEVLWDCVCDCGNNTMATTNSLKSGNTRSCGCYRNEKTGERFFKHGHNLGSGNHSVTYTSWRAMMQRCYNSNASDYGYYGGRGIYVCGRWHDFKNFLEDMGEKPSGLTIDRIDPDSDYNPFNCRWATRYEQTHNRRLNNVYRNHQIIIQGK